MTEARARVLKVLADGIARSKSDAAQEAGVSGGVIDGLIDEGTLETLVLPQEPVAQVPDPDYVLPELTDAQRAAADALKETMAKGGFSAFLIDGVTGSGKTEVYFEAVADNIRQGRQTLILMPEIALTTQFLNRFERALRHPAGGVAFATSPAQACSHMVGSRRRRSVGDCRRSLGVVSAIRRSRPDRGR